MKRKVAVLDVDGTIFRSSLLIELVDALIAEGIFKPETARIYEKAYEEWRNREGSYEDYIASVIAALRHNLAGTAYKDLRRVAYKVVAREKNRTYRYTRDLVKELKAKHYYLLAISHSPKLAVEAFCKTLGFNKVYGIMYETDSRERFTGEVMFRDIIFEKDKILERAVAEANLTLSGSVGVGDTESDIPFLELVSRPICFNPNQQLLAAAKKSGWRVIVERKDVVYKI